MSETSSSGTTGEAYRRCEAITREQARNFYYGIRLLPADKRAVLCAVYALARRIDDIGDGELPAADKSAQLAGVRRALADLDGGPASALDGGDPGTDHGTDDGTDPVYVAVADAARRFPIPLGAFGELVDGVEADVAGARYQTFDELVGYCRCVAGSVGRLCLGVFGHRPDPHASSYADALGIALQQTNILRDVREDLTNGRVYLPASDLERFGVELTLDGAGVLADPDGGLRALLRFSAERAASWYDDGLRLVPLLDWRSAACATAMAGIYSELNTRIAAHPSQVYDRRLALSGRAKAGVAVRALAGRRAAPGALAGRPT